jgi:hypothetical protein
VDEETAQAIKKINRASTLSAAITIKKSERAFILISIVKKTNRSSEWSKPRRWSAAGVLVKCLFENVAVAPLRCVGEMRFSLSALGDRELYFTPDRRSSLPNTLARGPK